MSNKNNRNKVLFYVLNLIVIVVVTGLTIYKIIQENGISTFSHIKNISLISLIMLTLIFFVNYYLEGLIIAISMKEYQKNFKTSQGFIIHSVGALFSAITPLKMGYLPSVGYAYSKFNVEGKSVIKSISKTSYTYQVWCLLLSAIALIVCFSKIL
jgi:uncharacterized membrane protein YbhN (UPF0104 family)